MMNLIIHHYKSTAHRPERFDQLIVDQMHNRLDATFIEHLAPVGESLQRAGDINAPVPASDPDLVILNDDAVIIENRDSGKFWIIDWQDPAHFTAQFGHTDAFAGATVTMYHMNWLADRVPEFHRCRAGIYSSLYPLQTLRDVDAMAPPKNVGMRENKLFFAGTIGDEIPYQNPDGTPRRQAVRILKERHPDDVVVWDRMEKKPRQTWLAAARSYKVSLAMAGHPHCSRENDLFVAGVPVIMPEMLNNISTNLQPNVHYFAAATGATWGCGAPVDADQMADSIWKTFQNIRHDDRELERVRHAARQYWRTHIDPIGAAIRIIEDIDWDLLY